MPNVLTAKVIKQLAQKYNLGEVYAEVDSREYGEDSKDKLVVYIYCRDPKNQLSKRRLQIDNELVEPMLETFESATKNYSYPYSDMVQNIEPHKLASVGFMAKGWPKVKQLLVALGIKFKIRDVLKYNKNKDLTPEGAKILGI